MREYAMGQSVVSPRDSSSPDELLAIVNSLGQGLDMPDITGESSRYQQQNDALLQMIQGAVEKGQQKYRPGLPDKIIAAGGALTALLSGLSKNEQVRDNAGLNALAIHDILRGRKQDWEKQRDESLSKVLQGAGIAGEFQGRSYEASIDPKKMKASGKLAALEAGGAELRSKRGAKSDAARIAADKEKLKLERDQLDEQRRQFDIAYGQAQDNAKKEKILKAFDEAEKYVQSRFETDLETIHDIPEGPKKAKARQDLNLRRLAMIKDYLMTKFGISAQEVMQLMEGKSGEGSTPNQLMEAMFFKSAAPGAVNGLPSLAPPESTKEQKDGWKVIKTANPLDYIKNEDIRALLGLD